MAIFECSINRNLFLESIYYFILLKIPRFHGFGRLTLREIRSFDRLYSEIDKLIKKELGASKTRISGQINP